jgi:hypothetical protein
VLTKQLATATDEQLPKLVRLLGTPATGELEEQRSTMMEWMENRRVDDGRAIIKNHPYEQVKPPQHVVSKEQCFGRYFSAREPYCAEKCAFAAECFHTLQTSVAQIIKGGSSLTESKEGLTKEERKKIMAKDIKNAKKAAAPVEPVKEVKKKKAPEPEEVEEEETIALEDDEIEEVEEDEEEAEEVEETEEEDEDDAEEVDEDEELEGSEDTEADDEDEEEEEEEEEEEKPAPKKAPAKAAPVVKEAPKKAEKAAPAPAKATSVTASLTKKVVPFAPFGDGVVVKLVSEENPLKASDSAFDLVNELYGVAEDQRVTQPLFLEAIQKVFVVSDDKAEQGEVCKGVAEELKEKGVLKLIRVKAQ